jgi:hypothetical protein
LNDQGKRQTISKKTPGAAEEGKGDRAHPASRNFLSNQTVSKGQCKRRSIEKKSKNNRGEPANSSGGQKDPTRRGRPLN